MGDQLANINRLEKDLWEAADNLRANSKLTSTEYCMPVLGVIFLRHAANRFDAATKEIEASGQKRKPVKADYVKRRALFLPEESRYDHLLSLSTDVDLGEAVITAMEKIEESFEPLAGVLPKEFTIFDRDVLEDLLRVFDSEVMKSATGDVFGRIYEYFLMKFAMQGAQDNGEFFTPPSLVQTIVNIIEPMRGVVMDPAAGSAGMFVQSSHFVERMGEDPTHNLTFYGQEKTATTIRLAKMNLAVHGLEGDIVEANTFYDDEHTLVGKCDYVMANPPFNVDMVDAEKIKGDVRLPFGLPSVNKKKKVSNGNYLWIQYFYSYLNDTGRTGFVMASSASDAGGEDKTIRKKLVETGHVDVMVSIGNNFFCTRTLPCSLWFLDRGKPDKRIDYVLMLDARGIYRKVTRVVNDFSPEQLLNISSIVWLYRGETDRYLNLVCEYLTTASCAGVELSDALTPWNDAAADLVKRLSDFASFDWSVFPDEDSASGDHKIIRPPTESIDQFANTVRELEEAWSSYSADYMSTIQQAVAHGTWLGNNEPISSKAQLKANERFKPVAEAIRGLIKQVDHVVKLGSAAIDIANRQLAAGKHDEWGGADIRRLEQAVIKSPKADASEEEKAKHLRPLVSAAMRLPPYLHRQANWLLSRFPDAEFVDVPGLCRLTPRNEIEASDWSLTPSRYVGVAPPEEDEDFDFDERMREIHIELQGLNEEATQLAETIDSNLLELIG